MSAPYGAYTKTDEIPHESRVCHNFPGSKYLLPADADEYERLNLQHRILKRAFGNRNLHVSLQEQTTPLTLLDSGTGTAIWLLEVARELPCSASLHGIDIEGRLLPKAVPPNVSFSINSITDLPHEWDSKFDVVNQRLLMASLTNSQWTDALANIFRVTRPGGWIQLCECEKTSGGNHTSRYASIIRELYKRQSLVINICEILPRLLEDAGFQKVQVLKASYPLGKWAGEEGIEGRTNMIAVYHGHKIPILRMGGFGLVKSEKEVDQILADVEKEWDTREGTNMGVIMFIAEKPLAPKDIDR